MPRQLPRARRAPPRRRQVPGLRRGQRPLHHQRAEEALRQTSRPPGGERYRHPHEDGSESRGRQPLQPYRQDPPRPRRNRRHGGQTGMGRPPPQERIIVVMHKPVTIVILAAGLGTRMKSRQAKVLHRAGGKTLLQHVVDTALALAPPERIFAVVGHQAGRVRRSAAGAGIGFIEQTEQRGTGHAVMIGRDSMAHLDGYLMVLYGDSPLLRAETLRRLIAQASEGSAPGEALGINDRAQLALADAIFRERKRSALMAAGVTLIKPETITIDSDVEIGMEIGR